MSNVPAPQVASKFIAIPTGSTLYTERWHVGAVTPSLIVVCVHGLGGSSHIFHPTIKPLLSLLPNAHILAYDQAGSALSPPTNYGATPLSVAHMLADLDALLAAEASAGPLVVVAHSAGTMLVARWLLKASPAVKRVTHVVFIGGPIAVPAPVEESKMRKRLAEVVEASGPSAILDSMLLPLLVGTTSMASRPLSVALVRTIGMYHDGKAYAASIRAFDSDIAPGAEEIDWEAMQANVKVLAICGDEDAMMAGLSEVAAMLSKSTFHTLNGVGHTPTVEAPEETAHLIEVFLKDQHAASSG